MLQRTGYAYWPEDRVTGPLKRALRVRRLALVQPIDPSVDAVARCGREFEDFHLWVELADVTVEEVLVEGDMGEQIGFRQEEQVRFTDGLTLLSPLRPTCG